MAGGVDSPWERVAEGGYCLRSEEQTSECEIHAQKRGAHAPAHVVQAIDRKVLVES